MHSKTLLLLLLLLLLYVSSLPLSLSESNYFDRYVNCQPIPYSCGDIHFNLSYPFHLEDAGRPDYCGSPDFHLTCISNNSTLTTSINGLNYQVTSVNTSSRVLSLVAGPFIGQMCPQPYFNTTFNFSDYEYTADDVNITVYSSCTEKPTTVSTLHNISCLSEGVGKPSSYYAVGKNVSLGEAERCKSATVVPMRRTVEEELRNGSLSFAKALGEGFELRWVIGSEWCGGCIDSGGVCGYNSSSSNSPTCFCPHGSFNGSCPQDDSIFDPERSKPKKGITIEVPAIVGSLLLLLFFLVYILQRNKPWKKASDDEETVRVFLQNYGSLSPKRYKYSEVKKMTKSFTQILGKGGYGTVYKGSLPDSHAVAVKILNESKGTNEDFINEVVSISRTSHVNVVSLLGFCLEKSKRALVYDFMPNGSLEKFIYTDKSTSSSEASLGCQKLYEIAIGIARGLEYLHRGCNTRIVHFDIKPHNILLDQDFCPKISDFGLAKLCHAKESIVSMCGMRGTPGYIAPEIFSRQFGVVSSKSDAYSYGMMVLEMVVGKGGMDAKGKSGNGGGSSSSEVYFSQGIYEHLEQYEDEVMSESDEIVKKMILAGLWCIQTMPGDRPTMSRVVEMLEGSLGDIKIPPRPKLF